MLTFLLALAVVGDANAVRTIAAVEGAHEFTLANLVLPGSASGRLGLRKCPTCTQVNFQVNGSTTYSFGGKQLPVAELGVAVAKLRQRDGARGYGVMFYNLATERVTRVVLNPPP